jgi:hypothetical protein
MRRREMESQKWPVVGSECVYLSRGPHGWAMTPERFRAVVLGFTAKGSVKIRAYDHVNDEHFTKTVRPWSIERPVGA